jgi:hypothetical protein
MIHVTEEELILHYYGETEDPATVEQHLNGCDACRTAFGSLQRILNVMEALPVPERSADYGAQVWERMSAHLPVRRRLRLFVIPWRWAAACAAMATLLIGAFLAGRFYPWPPRQAAPIAANPQTPQTQESILKMAVGDYLDRSQMVLIELANASPAATSDISAAQERAANLVGENRLYRQTAAATGDALVASVLDELERVLLEIAHSPSQLSTEQLNELQRRLRSDGILFRIRVLGSTVRGQEEHKL